MKRILSFLIVFSIQYSVFSFGVSAGEYSLRFYDDSDGLSHWHTTCTIQDSTGIIWIATYNGLNRFDGYRFVAFKATDSDGLPMSSDRIRKMELTADNNIICLIDDDNVVLFNTKTCRFEALNEKGYNPVNQIVGYIMSGDPTYITSYKGARSLIMKVERDELVEEMLLEYIFSNAWDVEGEGGIYQLRQPASKEHPPRRYRPARQPLAHR